MMVDILRLSDKIGNYKFSIKVGNIKYIDTADGPGVRTAVYFSGCSRQCEGCHNRIAWDYNYGEQLKLEILKDIICSLDSDYIAGLSILGGEPLDPENRKDVLKFIEIMKINNYIRKNQTIWLWTSYTYEEILENKIIPKKILKMIDFIVDGPFILDQRCLNLKFRGSKNQRIIDVQKSLKSNKIVIWEGADKK